MNRHCYGTQYFFSVLCGNKFLKAPSVTGPVTGVWGLYPLNNPTLSGVKSIPERLVALLPGGAPLLASNSRLHCLVLSLFVFQHILDEHSSPSFCQWSFLDAIVWTTLCAVKEPTSSYSASL